MSYFGDPSIPNPVYPCGQGAYTGAVRGAADASTVLGANVKGTVYQYKIAYEAATNKTYRFKTQQERMQYMMEANENCPS